MKRGHNISYWEELADATFSLCPSGWSPWSPRFFDRFLSFSFFFLLIPFFFLKKNKVWQWNQFQLFMQMIFNFHLNNILITGFFFLFFRNANKI